MKLYLYIARRAVLLIPVILMVTLITFIISRSVPADPVLWYFGPLTILTPEMIEKATKELGLDQPLYIQYFSYVANVAQGNFGWSFRTRRLVAEDLSSAFTATFELVMMALLLAILIGVPLGVISAVKRNRVIDHVTRVIALSGVSIPIFWLALMLQLFFFSYLGWLPIGKRASLYVQNYYPLQPITGLYTLDSLLTLNPQAFFDSLRHMILPASALAYRAIASIVRITRSTVLDVLQQDYIRTARSYGLPEQVVIYKYALKNSLITILTILAIEFGRLLQGSFLTETIFDWPGMGLYGVESILALDYPGILGVAIYMTFVYVLANLAVDVLYTLVDPRVRY